MSNEPTCRLTEAAARERRTWTQRIRWCNAATCRAVGVGSAFPTSQVWGTWRRAVRVLVRIQLDDVFRSAPKTFGEHFERLDGCVRGHCLQVRPHEVRATEGHRRSCRGSGLGSRIAALRRHGRCLGANY